MPRKTRFAGQDLATLGGRVELVLRQLYDGDQSKMATETGVSQPQISLVVGGRRSPGPKFIAGLAKIPGINIEWLRSGAGEPFAAAAVAAKPTGGRSLPIATCPLPGSPQVNAGLLSGASFPVAEPSFKGSRYFYAAQTTDPVVRAGLDVRPGDLLLFETDPAFWRPNVGVLHGKLCVLRLRTGSGAVCVLARANPLAGRLEPTFEVLGGPYERDSAVSGDDDRKLSDEDLRFYKRHGKFPGAIELEDWEAKSETGDPVPPVVAAEGKVEPRPPTRPTSQSADEPKSVPPSPAVSTRPSVDDVAGLCLLLIRTDVGS